MMDSASQETRFKLYLQEQHRPKWASLFPNEDGCTLIVLVLLDQLDEAVNLQLGFLGSNFINAPRQ